MMGWMAPLRHQCAKLVFLENHQEQEPSMSEITTIGLDLAKHVFQVHGVDAEGATVLRRRLRRNQVLAFFQPTSTLHCRGWKPVQRPTTGRASWPRSGTRCD
jgi:hypothetical protein